MGPARDPSPKHTPPSPPPPSPLPSSPTPSSPFSLSLLTVPPLLGPRVPFPHSPSAPSVVPSEQLPLVPLSVLSPPFSRLVHSLPPSFPPIPVVCRPSFFLLRSPLSPPLPSPFLPPIPSLPILYRLASLPPVRAGPRSIWLPSPLFSSARPFLTSPLPAPSSLRLSFCPKPWTHFSSSAPPPL